MRTTTPRSATFPVLLLGTILVLAACTPAAMHRPESVLEKEDFTLTFIEFDDQGEPWAPAQLERTIQVIDEEHNRGKRTLVVLFVHGWQNDASKREDRNYENNVEGFQRLLSTTRQMLNRAEESPDEVSLIGVYLSWRGRSTDLSLLQPLTFYSRRGAGQRAASVSTTEAILRVMATAKKNPLSTGVAIGHSFGGMIVELALAQAVVGYTLHDEAEIPPSSDMVILINPASQSMQAKNLVSMLKRNQLKFYREDKMGNRREAPLIASVTSTGDTVTETLYPMALSLKGWSKKFRDYDSSDCSPTRSQKEYYTNTAGHNRALHSHVISTAGSIDAGSVDDRQMVLEKSTDPKTGETRYTFPGEENLFTIERLPLSYNDTPYWIMSAPPELIRDHSEIFTYNTIQMIRALLTLSGGNDKTSKTIIVREDGIKPLELVALPNGDLAFLDASRRFFVQGEDNSRPFGLSCLPAVIQPDTVIGVFYEGEQAIVIASAEVLDGNKRNMETNVVVFDFGSVGSESLEWAEIKSDILFSAGTGNKDQDLIYLARAGELYVVDMTTKKLEPELLSTFDSSILIEEMKLDKEGHRILATDSNGSLYFIDLNSKTPTPEFRAGDLGTITDIDFSSFSSIALLLDTAGRKVLSIDCPRGADTCSEPEVFAAIPEFKQPISIARDTHGTIWVGDLGAQKIFAFDTDGEVVRVLDSISGIGN